MERERDQRYASVEDLADDLRRFHSNQPVTARPISWRYTASRFVRRNKLGMSFLVAALLLLIAATCTCAWLAVRAKEAEKMAANREVQALLVAMSQTELQHAEFPAQLGLLRLLAEFRERLALAYERRNDLASSAKYQQDALDGRQLLVQLPGHAPLDLENLKGALRARLALAERQGDSLGRIAEYRQQLKRLETTDGF